MEFKFKLAAAVIASSMLSGCAFQAPVSVSPNLNVYSSYGEKVPGHYLLYIEDDVFNRVVKPTGLSCAAHNYPLDIRQQFKDSTLKTMQQLVEDIQITDQAIPVSDLAKKNIAGMIVVHGEGMSARFQVIPGFFSSTADANVELSASVTVDGQSGRVLGTTAEGQGNAQSGSGGFCEGNAVAIGEATEKALKQLLGQLGERFANSPRVRAATNGKSAL